MESLVKDFIIKRKDLETKDKKLINKYTKIINNHKKLDIRFNNTNSNSDLIKIKNKSVKKIFDYLEEEIPEEHILFLFEKEDKQEDIQKNNDEYIISTNNNINNISNNEEEMEKEEKKDFLTFEVENPVLKKFKTLTHQIMKKYYFIFCLLCFIIAILFTIHLFSYLVSKELNLSYLDLFKFIRLKYIVGCGSLIGFYGILGYYYFTKYKTDKPSYSVIKKLQIFCLGTTIVDYILLSSKYFSPDELIEYYKNHYIYISIIYVLSFLCSLGILGFYFMVKKRRGNFSQYDEVLIQ
jgi:hypothetical protein